MSQTETDRLLEWAGWKRLEIDGNPTRIWQHDAVSGNKIKRIIQQGQPNLASLDVLHELEGRLTEMQHETFQEQLARVTADEREFISATAAQRLEALLLTLNLKDKK